MEVRNTTPFHHIAFQRKVAPGQTVAVVVVQGWFSLGEGALRPLRVQRGLTLAPRYRGLPGASSMAVDGVLATFKPRSDIHLDAVAYAPKGRPAPGWTASLSVGSLHKSWQLRGPHEWRSLGNDAWERTEPRPCAAVPLHYERAFGGSHKLEQQCAFEPRNPLGTGFIPWCMQPDQRICAPQIVAHDEPEHEPGLRYFPQGCGPLPPSWQPRLAHAGSYDDAWRHARWPLPPKDFRYEFNNSAHPDLIYPGYLRGDEPVVMAGISKAGTVRTRLPARQLWLQLRGRAGRFRRQRLNLDTVHFDLSSADPGDHCAFIVWRAVVGCHRSVSSATVSEFALSAPAMAGDTRAGRPRAAQPQPAAAVLLSR